MNSDRNIATRAGVLFIIAAVASITGLVLYTPILNNPNYIIETGLDNTQIQWGAFLEIITALSVIGTSISLYPVLRKFNETMAIGTVAFRILEATLITIGILCLLSIVTLNQGYSKGLTSDISSLLTAGKLLLVIHDWTFLFGPNVLLAPSTLITSYILFRMKLVPRVISVMGFLGGPLIFISAILVLFGLFLQLSVWGALFALPVFCYEMSLAIWLIIKGFNSEEIDSSKTKEQ